MKAIQSFFKKLFIYTITVAVIGGISYGGFRFMEAKNSITVSRHEVSTSTPTEKEVIIKGEFEELVKEYKASPEGQEVLNTWATQKAIDAQRAKLDKVEKDMLKKEASL